MALLFMDGFDNGIDVTKWNDSNGTFTSSTSTRFGAGKCITEYHGYYLVKSFTAANKIFVGFAFNPNATTTWSSYPLLVFYGDSGSTPHLFLHMPVVGQLTLRLGVYNGTILANGAIPQTGWQYLEMSATIAATGGTAQIRVNSQTVVDYSGNTKYGGTNTTIDRVKLADGNSLKPLYFDDFYICDDTGTTNNTFLGDVRVQTLMPSAAGSSTQLTPTGGANYANVSEAPDSTATYNSSSTVGDRDTYALADLAASTNTIYGVQNSITAWKTDAGMGGLKTAIRVGGSVYYDTTVSLGSSAASYVSPVRETNPATSTAWTPTDINNAELGAEVA